MLDTRCRSATELTTFHDPQEKAMTAASTAIVIGGGIAGPVAATALQQAGISATVHEAYAEVSDGIGGDLALAANGMRALGIIGTDEAVRAIALPITGQIMSVNGRRLELPGLDGVEPMQMVGRGDLQRVLRDRAVEAGVEFRYDERLVAVENTSTGVTAIFSDGTTATADVLIGADGVRSTVRTLIDPAAPGAGYTGLLGFQGSADLDLDLDPGVMTFAFGKRAYYLYWRTGDGRVTWGANLPSKQYLSTTDARKTPAADWLTTLRETYGDDSPGDQLATLTTEDTLQVLGAIHIMPPVPHWHRGRMVLVGDAVHAPSNSTGQGASLAIESAIQLARCLRDLPDPISAFAAYEGLRRERVEKITRRGARTNNAKTPGPVGRRIMQTVMPLFFKLMNFEKTIGPEQRYTIDWDEHLTVSHA
jgi:2-polyprenyl-6-methoxyphenol hydroxylase-like FAD-dependent oxidoreductase